MAKEPMNLFEQLRRDEGWKRQMYEDSEGHLTIGCGHKLRGGYDLSDAAIECILLDDVEFTDQTLRKLAPWVETLDIVRREALLNMGFNVGVAKMLRKNPLMIGAVRHMDWEEARRQLLGGTYEAQVGDRARRLGRQLLTGLRQ